MADNRFKLTRADEFQADEAVDTVKDRDVARRDSTHTPRPSSRSKTPRVSVVYYLIDESTNEVKIAVTQQLDRRMAIYREGNRHLFLAAVEDGGYELKHERHRQFAHLRVERDWFKFVAPLTDHVTQLLRVSAGSVISQVGTSNIGVARRFLEDQLSLADPRDGVRPLDAIRAAAVQANIKWRAVERAKGLLRVRSVKSSGFPATVIGWAYARSEDGIS